MGEQGLTPLEPLPHRLRGLSYSRSNPISLNGVVHADLAKHLGIFVQQAKKFMSKRKEHSIVKLSTGLLAKTWHIVKSFVPCSPEV